MRRVSITVDLIDCHRHRYDMRFGEIGFGPGEAATSEVGSTMSLEDGTQMATTFGAGSARQGGVLGRLMRTGSAVAGCQGCGQR